MRFELTVTTDNAAFDDDNRELVRILENAIGKLCQGETDASLRDINGTRVGGFEFTDN